MNILIPIYIDGFLHPLHKDNELSLIYVKHIGDKDGKLLCLNHPDGIDIDDIAAIKNDHHYFYLTPDVKKIKHIFPDTRLIDINYLNWKEKNVPLDMDKIRVNAYDYFQSKYYNLKGLNKIIPLIKHKEYCENLSNLMSSSVSSVYESVYMSEAITAFHTIETNGIKVSDDVCDIFDERVRKHISDGKLYSQYNLWTSTGRPSNSFGNVNFAALTPEQRKAFLPENDYMVEFDFDAYHLRLIGDLIKYDFGKDSVHKHLAKYYECSYEESKQRSFKLLYGGIDKKTREKVPFFDEVQKYINLKWSEFNSNKYVFTDIYRRKLLYNNYQDMNRNKLFNYLIQAYETESNIKKILLIQDYLLNKKTKLVLYGYDSFLFDFSNKDGVETLTEIRNILEEGKHYTKSKMGLNYGEMKDITNRL